MNLGKLFLRYGLILMFVSLFATVGFANNGTAHGGEFCDNNNYSNGDKVSFRDLREIKLPNLSLLEVDGKKNGGISVKGENRTDILVRACVQTWAETDAEAKAFANNTRIETSGYVRAENGNGEENWSVSYQILVPTSTNLKLTAHNGGISISSVNGTLEFETKNGGLHLANVSGNVKGRTTNGGVHVNLSGNTWNGSGLDVETTNGGVKLMLPVNYSANIETGTVNGGLKSDFPELSVEKDEKDGRYYRQNKHINASLNGGGAPIRVLTTNGGVSISSSTDSK
jgi:hypothetical protein